MELLKNNIAVKKSPAKKVSLDKLIEEIMNLKAKEKEIKARIEEKTAEITKMYKQPANIKEIIAGKKYQAEKMPKNMGRNDFDPKVVAMYLKALPDNMTDGIIYTKELVDADKFNALVKLKIITPEMAQAARRDNWTFWTKFGIKKSDEI